MALATPITVSQEASGTDHLPDRAASLNPAIFNVPTIQAGVVESITGRFSTILKAQADQQKEALISGHRRDLSRLLQFFDACGMLEHEALNEAIKGGFQYVDILNVINKSCMALTEALNALTNDICGEQWPFAESVALMPTVNGGEMGTYERSEHVGILFGLIDEFDIKLDLDGLSDQHKRLVVTACDLMSRTFGDCMVGKDIFDANYWFEEARDAIKEMLREDPDISNEKMCELCDFEEYGIDEAHFEHLIHLERLVLSKQFVSLTTPFCNHDSHLEVAEAMLRHLWSIRHDEAYQHPYMRVVRLIAHYVRQFEKRGLSNAYDAYERAGDSAHPSEAMSILLGYEEEEQLLWESREYRMQAGEGVGAIIPVDDADAFSTAHDKLKMMAIQQAIFYQLNKATKKNG